MYSLDKSLDGPRNGMDAEEKIELPRTFKGSNPDSLLFLALHRLNYPGLWIVTKNENIFGSCRIVLYFHVWKISLVFVVTDFVCGVNLTSEQKAVKHCFISGAHCCVTATERNRANVFNRKTCGGRRKKNCDPGFNWCSVYSVVGVGLRIRPT